MSWVPSSQGSCAHASQGGSLRSHWETQRLHQLLALCPLLSHWEEGLGRKGWSTAGAQSEQDCPGSISVCAPPSKVSSPPEKKKKKDGCFLCCSSGLLPPNSLPGSPMPLAFLVLQQASCWLSGERDFSSGAALLFHQVL